MSDPATKRFTRDYRSFVQSLEIPHPYFQQLEYEKVNGMIIREVLKRKHDRVLDIGSGAGHLITGVSAVSPGCFALDIEASRLVHVSSRNPGIFGVCANGEMGLPFQESTFDVVIASELLEHLNDPNGFFQEVSRILRPKGALILTTPNSENLTFRILRALPRSLSRSIARKFNLDMRLHPELIKGQKIDDRDPHAHKVEGYSREELRRFGGKHGMRTVYLKTFGLPLPDKTLSRLPRFTIRFIVDHLEDAVPYALRHLIVYEKK